MNEPTPEVMYRPGNTGTTAAPDRRPGGHVLVVDDDVAVGMVLSRAVIRFGYNVSVAVDGPKALAIFSLDPSRYVLALLDYKLPGMCSGDVHRELRALRPDLPVVLMSGYNREEAIEKSAGIELAGFLHKPFNMETLASALSFALPA
jgi:two-component system cell cycle sensor histidine kinase/response regulator CckA